MSQKIAAAMPVRAADKQAPAQYIRYEFEQFHHCLSAEKVNRESWVVFTTVNLHTVTVTFVGFKVVMRNISGYDTILCNT